MLVVGFWWVLGGWWGILKRCPGRGKSSVEMGCVRGKIAAREKVETRVCVVRRGRDAGFDELA